MFWRNENDELNYITIGSTLQKAFSQLPGIFITSVWAETIVLHTIFISIYNLLMVLHYTT